MIRINLLGEKVDHSFSYLLQGVGFVSCLAVAVFCCFMWQTAMEDGVEQMKGEEARLRQSLVRLERVTKEIDDLELKKKTLREKLQTISLLKAKKHGPVHILDDINLSIPDRAWLTSIKEKSGLIELSGVALDNQTVAIFMNSLSKGKYFGTPELLLSTEYIKDDVKLQQFSLSVAIRDPLKAKASEEAPGATATDQAATPLNTSTSSTSTSSTIAVEVTTTTLAAPEVAAEADDTEEESEADEEETDDLDESADEGSVQPQTGAAANSAGEPGRP